jgi:PGF-CTERM protein
MKHAKSASALMAISVALAVILGFTLLPLAAQPPQPPDVVILSEPIRLHADPVNIVADGVSTSTIFADVVWPDGWGELSGTPACLVNVTFYTTLGTITPYNITMPTPDNQSCITIATLTAGTTAGSATITAFADIAPLEETALVRNTTTVTLYAPGTLPTPTPTPSNGGGNGGDGGDGGGGDGGVTTPTPTTTATSTPAPTGGMTPTPAPTNGGTATPSGAPTASPLATPTTTVTPTPTQTPSPIKEPIIPGFGAAFAIIGLLTLAYLVIRRR